MLFKMCMKCIVLVLCCERVLTQRLDPGPGLHQMPRSSDTLLPPSEPWPNFVSVLIDEEVDIEVILRIGGIILLKYDGALFSKQDSALHVKLWVCVINTRLTVVIRSS